MYGGRWFFQTYRPGQVSEGNVRGHGEGDKGSRKGDRTVHITESFDRPKEEVNFHKIIWEHYLPLALKIGVPYELFWHLNPTKLIPFIKAYGQKQQERSDEMWMMGQFVMAALDATVCNMMPFVKRKGKGKYPEKPYRVIPMTEEERRQEEDKELQKFLGFADSFEKDVKKKNEGM